MISTNQVHGGRGGPTTSNHQGDTRKGSGGMVHHIFISTIDTQGKIQERLKRERKKSVRKEEKLGTGAREFNTLLRSHQHGSN